MKTVYYRVELNYDLDDAQADAIMNIAEEVIKNRLTEITGNPDEMTQSEWLAVLAARLGDVGYHAHQINQLIKSDETEKTVDWLTEYRKSLVQLAATVLTTIEAFDDTIGKVKHDIQQDDAKGMGSGSTDS